MDLLNLLQNEEVPHLYDYHAYWIYPEGVKTKNPEFDHHSGMLLNLKKKELPAINHFLPELRTRIPAGSTLCIVPSHDPAHLESGIKEIGMQLVLENRVINGLDCLQRHLLVTKLATGGNRSIQVHLKSIRVINNQVIKGKNVFLLDDITTTGNSLKACKKLLLDAGAASVQLYALGKTTH